MLPAAFGDTYQEDGNDARATDVPAQDQDGTARMEQSYGQRVWMSWNPVAYFPTFVCTKVILLNIVHTKGSLKAALDHGTDTVSLHVTCRT